MPLLTFVCQEPYKKTKMLKGKVGHVHVEKEGKAVSAGHNNTIALGNSLTTPR